MKKTNIILAALIALLTMPLAANAKENKSSLPSAKDVAELMDSFLPVNVRASDMMTKIYGLVADTTSKDDAMKYLASEYNLTPEEDEYGMWLDSDAGYSLSYFGMKPRVSAMAFFDPSDGSVGNYEYFFIFPYRDGHRGSANRSVTEFCSNLIQEIGDLGVDPGVNVTSDAIFEVVAEYDNRAIDVILTEDSPTADADGRFLLTLSVVPA